MANNNKAIRVFLLMDLFCSSITTPYFADFVIGSLGGSSELVGLLVGLRCLFTTLFAPILGSLSDKYGRKSMIFVVAIGTWLTAVMELNCQTIFVYMLSRIVFGMTRACVPICNGAVCDAIDLPQERKQAVATNGAMVGIGSILGIAIGGFLSEYGYFVPGVVNVSVSSLSIAWVTLFVAPTPKKIDGKDDSTSIFSAFKEIKMDSNLTKLSIFHTLLTFFIVSVQYATMEYPRVELNLSPSVRGIIFISLGILFTVTQSYLTKLEKMFGGPQSLLSLGCFISAIANFLMLIKGVYTFIIAQFLVTVFSIIIVVTLGAVTSNTKDSIRGSIHGLHEGLANFSLVIGAFIFPSLMTILPEMPFVIGGIAMLMLGFVSSSVPYIKAKIQ